MLKREIQSCAANAESVTPATDILDFLKVQAEENNFTTLFAIADDGVIWGRYEDGKFITSHEAAAESTTVAGKKAAAVCPSLREETLQEARLFGADGECYCWREAPQTFKARILSDNSSGSPDWTESFDEHHLLWGTETEPLEHNFTLLTHGAEGLRHAIPRPFSLPQEQGKTSEAIALKVRHYLDSEARIVASRLVEIEPIKA